MHLVGEDSGEGDEAAVVIERHAGEPLAAS